MYVHICINRRKNKIPAAIASPTTTASTASATAAASPPGIRADLDTHLVVQALAAVEIPARIPLQLGRVRARRETHTDRHADNHTQRKQVRDTIDHLHHSRRETDTA